MRRLKQNIIYNLLQTLIPTAAWVVLIPVIVQQLGVVQFGVWALLQALIGQMGILDLGIGPTVIRQVSDAASRCDYDKARRVSGDAILVYVIGGGIAGLTIGFGLPAFMGEVFKIPEEIQPLLPTIAGLVGIQIMFSLPGSVFTSIPRGMQRYDVYAIQRVGQIVLMSALIFVSIGLHLGLVGVIASGALSMLVMYLFSAVWVWRRAPRFMPQLFGGSLASLKQLTMQSVWLFILQVSGVLVFSTSKLIVGAFVSLESVAVLEVALRVFDFLRVIVTALTDALMPAASSLHAIGESDQVRRLFLVGTSFVWLFTLCIVVPLFVVAPWITQMWVGTTLGLPAALVLRILLVGFCAYSLTRVPMSILIGIGQIRTYVVVRAVSALLIPFAVWVGAHMPHPLVAAVIANACGLLVFDGFLFLYAASLFRSPLWELVLENSGVTISMIVSGVVVLLVQSNLTGSFDPLVAASVLLIAWILFSVLISFIGSSLKLWQLSGVTNFLRIILGRRGSHQAL